MIDNFSMFTQQVYLFEMLPSIDQVKVVIVLAFSGVVSLGCMVYFRHKQADIGVWQNLFLTCLGYIVGILTGLFLPIPSKR